MREISERERAGLLRASAAICSAALLLLPMAAQSSQSLDSDPGATRPSTPLPTVAPPRRPRPADTIARDPFEPAVADQSAIRSEGVVLLAFASGVRPVALIDIGGKTIAVAAGDPAFGSRVTYLDARIVRLADGRVFALRQRP